ncbi:hypothetical protein [Secundilactobacillus collinoides]|uniref:Uncharacterized protein n=1 Tax=Secundilactobacillus collinoides TaxID=33960 RepID=A0A166FT27_SECCO|nr:hypothetical protein [Secundilactobacillus collinoides]KZL35758.1 hypothetical protein TY91_15555 [Secundilactobacillus collinoides]
MWRKATKGATNYFVILLVVDVIFEPLSLIFKHHSNGLLGLFISILRAKNVWLALGSCSAILILAWLALALVYLAVQRLNAYMGKDDLLK